MYVQLIAMLMSKPWWPSALTCCAAAVNIGNGFSLVQGLNVSYENFDYTINKKKTFSCGFSQINLNKSTHFLLW